MFAQPLVLLTQPGQLDLDRILASRAGPPVAKPLKRAAVTLSAPLGDQRRVQPLTAHDLTDLAALSRVDLGQDRQLVARRPRPACATHLGIGRSRRACLACTSIGCHDAAVLSSTSRIYLQPSGNHQYGSQGIIASVADCFTRPSFRIFTDLMAGWVLTPGRRTITRIIGVIDPEGRRAHDAYHRLLRDGVWQMPRLWQTLAVTIVETLVDDDAEVSLDLDDTVHHKTGRKIEGAGIFRDAVRSTRNRVVYGLGLNLVVVTVRIVPPWGGMPIGLPVNVRIRRKNQGDTTVELARQMLVEIASWLPDRHFQLAADGAYASLCGAGLQRVHVTSRLRRDAAVYELTPPRTGRRGRPRKKGDRLPALAAMAAAATSWRTVEFDQRGTTVTRKVWARRLLWYHVAKDRPLLLVIVRDPDGIQPDDYFITTDTDAEPAQVAARYSGRWSEEVSFRDEKAAPGR
jgi:hypothetical protein